MAASNSIIQPRGMRNQAGQSSERKIDIPMPIGNAITIAIRAVIKVP